MRLIIDSAGIEKIHTSVDIPRSLHQKAKLNQINLSALLTRALKTELGEERPALHLSKRVDNE